MGRFIIVDEKHRDDGFRREEMRQRMSGSRGDGFRMEGHRNAEEEYDEGYRTGYEHGYRDHEEESMRRSRSSSGRFM